MSGQSHASSSAQASDDRTSQMRVEDPPLHRLEEWLHRATYELREGVAERTRLESESHVRHLMVSKDMSELDAVRTLGDPVTANREFRATCLDESRAERIRKQFGPHPEAGSLRVLIYGILILGGIAICVLMPVTIPAALGMGIACALVERENDKTMAVVRSQSGREGAAAFRKLLLLQSIVFPVGFVFGTWIMFIFEFPAAQNLHTAIGCGIGGAIGASAVNVYRWVTLSPYAEDCVAIIQRAWDDAEAAGDV